MVCPAEMQKMREWKNSKIKAGQCHIITKSKELPNPVCKTNTKQFSSMSKSGLSSKCSLGTSKDKAKYLWLWVLAIQSNSCWNKCYLQEFYTLCCLLIISSHYYSYRPAWTTKQKRNMYNRGNTNVISANYSAKKNSDFIRKLIGLFWLHVDQLCTKPILQLLDLYREEKVHKTNWRYHVL